MKPKILIIGSTGKLGTKLLSFCFKNKININCITSFSNIKKLNLLKSKYNIKNSFSLSDLYQKKKFMNFLKNNKFKIVYFLDYGSLSIEYIDIINHHHSNVIFAIANKELIIAGGKILQLNLKKNNNLFIPLDSEHFSLLKSNFRKDDLYKVYITASGGPFYFNKSINLNNVSTKSVLSHPKWKMGYNNLIDSSNFMNKLLEIYELSVIFDINLSKVDFLVSREAFIHSIVEYNDSSVQLNCFKNDMIITMVNPLSSFYNFNLKTYFSKKIEFFDYNKLKFEKFNDKRFKISNYRRYFKKLSHNQIIYLMLLNNMAQKLYLNKKLEYNQIISFNFKNLKKIDIIKLRSLKEINEYVKNVKKSINQQFNL